MTLPLDVVAYGPKDGEYSTGRRLVPKAAGFYPADYHFPACPVDGELREADAFSVGDCQLRAIETSGHCSGMLSFLITGERRTDLFSGATMFHGGKILMTNVHDCDFQQYVKSVQKLGKLSVDAPLSGHLCVAVRGAVAHSKSPRLFGPNGSTPNIL